MSRFPSLTSGWARRSLWSAAAIMAAGTLATTALGAAPASAHPSAYRQINLVSDQRGKAPLTDPDLVNAWGLAASPGTDAAPRSPLWVADNGSDKATLYNGKTPTSVSKASLVVSVTGAAPTGQVFNPDTSAFVVRDKKGNSGSAVFIFDTENGTIDGWNPKVGAKGSKTSTVTEVAHNRGAKAVYKGLPWHKHLMASRTCTPPTSTPGGSRYTTGPSSGSACLVGGSWIRSFRLAMGRSASPRSTASCM
jgi:hypothetical protein